MGLVGQEQPMWQKTADSGQFPDQVSRRMEAGLRGWVPGAVYSTRVRGAARIVAVYPLSDCHT